MSVETELADLREDFRSMRAAFDSFIKTFQGDTMSRLATVEQWKITQAAECLKTEVKVEALQRVAERVALVPDLVTTVAALKAQNDKQEGSISALKWVGGLVGGLLSIAEIVHTVIAIARGH